MSDATVGPVRAGDRFESLDTLRGVALFGILLMNITAFGLPHAYSDPTVYGGAEGADLWSWIITQMGFEGTQRGLFSLLFGAGVVLFVSKLEAAGRKNAADIYFRRNLWLVVFGVIHCFVLLWLGEILFFYGVTALFVFAFRKMAPKHLIAIAAAGLIFNAGWNLLDTRNALDLAAKNAEAEALEASGQKIDDDLAASVEEWEALVSEYKSDEDTLQKDIEAHQSGYWKIATFQAPTGTYFESWWLYRYFFDIFSMMLLGMALFKMGVLTLEKKMRYYLLMMLIGYPIGLVTNYFETAWIMKHDFSVVSFLQANVTYDLGRLAMTLGHVGALLAFCQSGVLSILRKSLAAVGRMALTNYVSHTVICAFIFYGFGFGLYGELQRHELYYVVFGIWIFQLIASPLWLSRFRFGPLEWGWRALTYMQRPSMRKPIPNAPAAPAI